METGKDSLQTPVRFRVFETLIELNWVWKVCGQPEADQTSCCFHLGISHLEQLYSFP